MKGQKRVSSPVVTRHSQLTLAALATYEELNGITAAYTVRIYMALHKHIFGSWG